MLLGVVNKYVETLLYECTIWVTSVITKIKFAVLEALSSGYEATLDDLVAETESSRTHLYRVLDDLLMAGLLTERRGHHNQRRVRVTDNPVVESYRQLTSELSHVNWPDLLSPTTICVCWYLNEPRRVAAIADRLHISRQRVYSALSPLKNRAMLSPTGPEYALADDLQPLLKFAQALVLHEHQQRARNLAPSAIVEWCDPKRALIRVTKSADAEAFRLADDWKVTGLAAFRAFGLQFYLSGEPAFWYAPTKELSPAEVVCHTLVLGSNSRRVSYAMLLIETTEIDETVLTDVADWYGVTTEVAEMYRALNGDFDSTVGCTGSLPSESEYSALKAQYTSI